MIKFKKLDDEMHFWAGFLICLFAFMPVALVLSEWIAAVGAFSLTTIVAIGKELYDKYVKKTRFDERDLKWTLIGALIPALIFITANLMYHYSKP